MTLDKLTHQGKEGKTREVKRRQQEKEQPVRNCLVGGGKSGQVFFEKTIKRRAAVKRKPKKTAVRKSGVQ